MMVAELITRLQRFDPEAMVYVPSLCGPTNNGTVRFVATLSHDGSHDWVPGVSIPPDVALLPGDMEGYITDQYKTEDRMGDT